MPLETAVAKPVEVTDTTPSFDELQVTDWPGTNRPSSLRGPASNCRVFPMKSSSIPSRRGMVLTRTSATGPSGSGSEKSSMHAPSSSAEAATVVARDRDRQRLGMVGEVDCIESYPRVEGLVLGHGAQAGVDSSCLGPSSKNCDRVFTVRKLRRPTAGGNPASRHPVERTGMPPSRASGRHRPPSRGRHHPVRCIIRRIGTIRSAIATAASPTNTVMAPKREGSESAS